MDLNASLQSLAITPSVDVNVVSNTQKIDVSPNKWRAELLSITRRAGISDFIFDSPWAAHIDAAYRCYEVATGISSAMSADGKVMPPPTYVDGYGQKQIADLPALLQARFLITNNERAKFALVAGLTPADLAVVELHRVASKAFQLLVRKYEKQFEAATDALVARLDSTRMPARDACVESIESMMAEVQRLYSVLREVDSRVNMWADEHVVGGLCARMPVPLRAFCATIQGNSLDLFVEKIKKHIHTGDYQRKYGWDQPVPGSVQDDPPSSNPELVKMATEAKQTLAALKTPSPAATSAAQTPSQAATSAPKQQSSQTLPVKTATAPNQQQQQAEPVKFTPNPPSQRLQAELSKRPASTQRPKSAKSANDEDPARLQKTSGKQSATQGATTWRKRRQKKIPGATEREASYSYTGEASQPKASTAPPAPQPETKDQTLTDKTLQNQSQATEKVLVNPEAAAVDRKLRTDAKSPVNSTPTSKADDKDAAATLFKRGFLDQMYGPRPSSATKPSPSVEPISATKAGTATTPSSAKEASSAKKLSPATAPTSATEPSPVKEPISATKSGPVTKPSSATKPIPTKGPSSTTKLATQETKHTTQKNEPKSSGKQPASNDSASGSSQAPKAASQTPGKLVCGFCRGSHSLFRCTESGVQEFYYDKLKQKYLKDQAAGKSKGERSSACHHCSGSHSIFVCPSPGAAQSFWKFCQSTGMAEQQEVAAAAAAASVKKAATDKPKKLLTERELLGKRWVVSKEAPAHMTPCVAFIRRWENYTDFTTDVEQEGGGTRTVRAEGLGFVGTIPSPGEHFLLQEVIFIRGIQDNIISVQQLQLDGYKVVFSGKTCSIKLGAKVVATASLIDGVYLFNGDVLTSSGDTAQDYLAGRSSTVTDYNVALQWHRAFGHCDVGMLRRLQNNNVPSLNERGEVAFPSRYAVPRSFNCPECSAPGY